MAAIDILGSGAIGCLWAGYLARQGHQIRLLGRRDIDSDRLSLTLTLRDNSDYRIDLPYATGPKLGQQPELLLVTTKAYQVADALAPWLEQQLPLPPIVLMHNGMGALAELSLPPAHPVLLATTSHGALMAPNTNCAPSARSVRHTGLGDSYLGLARGELALTRQQQIHHWQHQALPAVHWCDNIQHELWFKLAINCAINPLTAIHDCRNGALAAPQFDEQLQQICGEIAAIMQRLKLATTAAELRRRVDRVIALTAENYSSMHQDITHGRRSEIDYISGHVVREAERLSLPAPVNRQLWRQIKHMETTRP